MGNKSKILFFLFILLITYQGLEAQGAGNMQNCSPLVLDDPIVKIIQVYNPSPSPAGEWIKIKVVGYPNDPGRLVDLSGWILDDNNVSTIDVGNEPGHIRLGSCFNNIPPGTEITFTNIGGIAVSGWNCDEIESCEDIPNHEDPSYNCPEYSSGGSWRELIPMRNFGDAVQIRNQNKQVIDMVSWGSNVGGQILDFPYEGDLLSLTPPERKVCNNCGYIGDDPELCEGAEVIWGPEVEVDFLRLTQRFIDMPSDQYPDASPTHPFVCPTSSVHLYRIIKGCEEEEVTEFTIEEIEVQVEGPDYLCGEAELIPHVTGADVDSYHWSTNETTRTIMVDEAGTYTVTVTSVYGTEAEASFDLQAGTWMPEIRQTPMGACDQKMVRLDALVNLENPTYSWSTGENTSNILVKTSGDYQVTITDEDSGCERVATATINISIEDFSALQVLPEAPEYFPGTTELLQLASKPDWVAYLQWTTPGESMYSGEAIPITSGGLYSLLVITKSGCSHPIDIEVKAVDTEEDLSGCTGGGVMVGIEDRPANATCIGWEDEAGMPITEGLENPLESRTMAIQSGTYILVFADDRGDIVSKHTFHVDLSPLEVSILPDAVALCHQDGDPIEIEAVAADDYYGDFSYLWSNGATGSLVALTQNGSIR